MPKLPEREKSSGSRDTSRPFTAMALSGLSAGLSWRDMRHMKYTHLMQLLYEWDDMNGAEATETREATPSDVSALMNL